MTRRSHARRKTTFAAILTLAAAALLSPVALMSAWVHAESLPMQVYSTAIGEIRRVVLNEWLAMRLNTGSGATVTSSAQLCEVTLDHGEALFELERESPLPLRVLAGDTALNTRAAKFSVRVRDMKTVDVIVRSGQVTVGVTTIRERQSARISAAGVILRDLNPADVERRLEWTTGHLTFAGETLAEATAEFNRYNTHRLVIADRAISSIPIGGTFLSSDVESFVAALRPLGVARMKGGPGDGDNVIRLVGAARAAGAKSAPGPN